MVRTSLDGWYDYDQATNLLAPHRVLGSCKAPSGNATKFKFSPTMARPTEEPVNPKGVTH
jgi:hypothetical protein